MSIDREMKENRIKSTNRYDMRDGKEDREKGDGVPEGDVLLLHRGGKQK